MRDKKRATSTFFLCKIAPQRPKNDPKLRFLGGLAIRFIVYILQF